MRRFFVLMDIRRRYDILLSVAVAEKTISTLKEQPFDLLFCLGLHEDFGCGGGTLAE